MFGPLKRQLHPLSSGASTLTPPWQNNPPRNPENTNSTPATPSAPRTWRFFLAGEMGFGAPFAHPRGLDSLVDFQMALNARAGLARTLGENWSLRMSAGYQYSRQAFRMTDDLFAGTFTDEDFFSHRFIAQAQTVFTANEIFSLSVGLGASLGSYQANRESNDPTVVPTGIESIGTGTSLGLSLPLQIEIGTPSIRASAAFTPDLNMFSSMGTNVGFRLGLGLCLFIH